MPQQKKEQINNEVEIIKHMLTDVRFEQSNGDYEYSKAPLFCWKYRG